MNLEKEGSTGAMFYDEESCEASSNEERLMMASFSEGLIDDSFYNEGSANVESPIEASFYEETVEANPKENKDPLDIELKEVSRSFRPFELIDEILERFTEELRQQQIHVNEFDGFNLGIMRVLNALNKGDTVEKFLRQAYIGCFQCLLCLQLDKKLSRTSQMLGHHLSNALSVLRYVLSKQGVSIPDLNSEEIDYEKCKLGCLTELTKRYLHSRPNYEFLRRHEELIKDFKVVSEIDLALHHLQDEFEELRRRPHTRRLNEFTLFSQLEETTDLSWCCC